MSDGRSSTNRVQFVTRNSIPKLVEGKLLTQAQANELLSNFEVVAKDQNGFETLVRLVG
jgi:hypothetical protein